MSDAAQEAQEEEAPSTAQEEGAPSTAQEAQETTAQEVQRFSTRCRKALMNRISQLGNAAHEEIFRILSAHGTNHTRNKYGIHINLSAVHDTVIGEISSFVDYCISNDQDLREYDKRLEEYKVNKRFDALPSLSKGTRPAVEEEAQAEGASTDERPRSAPCSGPSVATEGRSPPLALGDGDGRGGGRGGRGGGGGGGGNSPRSTMQPEYDDAQLQRMRTYMQFDNEGPGKKRSCSSKFNLAKKRFSKTKRVDRRGGFGGESSTDLASELQPEPYVIIAHS